jgi:KRAB domain-containing zinc finger protein
VNAHPRRLAELQLPQVGNTSSIVETPEELFLCDEKGCKIVFASSSELQLHKQKHKENKMFLCGNCFSSFPTRVELANHVKSHLPRKHPKVDNIECQLCNKNFPRSKLAEHSRMNHFNCTYIGCKQTFSTSSELKAHVLSHCTYSSENFDSQLKKFSQSFKSHKRRATSVSSAGLGSPTAEHRNQWHPCHFPGCSFTFKLLSALAKHKRSAHSDKTINFKLECDWCCKQFTSKAALQNHILGEHLSTFEPMFPCDKCGHRFYTEGNRKAHLRLKHNIIVPPTLYLCDQCPKSFNLTSALEQHQRTHTGEKRFVCSKCGKRYSQMQSLKKHLLTHERLKKNAPVKPKATLKLSFVCEVCGKGFATSGTYKKHSLTHNERDIECPVCGWKTNNKVLLKSHIQNNHTKKPLLQCDFCDVTSTSRHYLTRHSAIHDDEAPVVTFDCHICSKKLKHQKSLASHLKLHQRHLDFECDRCDAAFNRTDLLNRHLFEKHGILQHKCKVCGLEFAKLVLLKSHMMHKKHYDKKALASL